jgi:hypothetical protein
LNTNTLRDLHQFNFETLEWKKIDLNVEKIGKTGYFHSVLYKNEMYLFGDIDVEIDLNLNELDLESNIFKINLEKKDSRKNFFSELLHKEIHPDITFELNDQTLKAHKFIVSKNQTLQEMIENENLVKLDYSFDSFKKVVQFIYLGEIEFDSIFELFDILLISIDLKMNSLESICYSHFDRHINASNVLSVYEKSENISNIRKLCLSFIKFQCGFSIQSKIENLKSLNIDEFQLELPEKQEEIQLNAHLHKIKEKYTDLEIITNDRKSFHVHKSLMCVYSDYFRGMFSGEYLEKNISQINLEEIDAECFQFIYDFIYHVDQTICDDLNSILEVIRASDLLLMISLKQFYVHHLKEKINHQNVIGILNWSDEYNIYDVREKCIEELLHSEDHLTMLELRNQNIHLQKQVSHLEKELDDIVVKQNDIIELLKNKLK